MNEKKECIAEKSAVNTRNIIRRNVLVILITVIVLFICIMILNYLVRPVDTDGAYSQIETFHSLPEDSVEVLIYGSSHAFRGINPIEMYVRYGIGAYNYAWHWQALNTTSLFIKDSLKKQNPKVVLIECYNVNTVLEDVDMNAEIYYSRYIKDFSSKMDYIKQCFSKDKERYLAYFMPLCAFHDNWNTLSQASFSRLEGKNWLFNTMGFAGSNDTIPIGIPDYSTYEQKELSQTALDELDSIVSLCKEKNTEIVFYTVPWHEPFNYGESMKKYAMDNGCMYVDLCEKVQDVGLDGLTDFSDPWHLNTNGANKVADYMGAILVSNYELTDMRKIKGNLWEDK